ncbi:MAG: hypothetical protein Q9222_003417 [Ikaeria aurantiellina]
MNPSSSKDASSIPCQSPSRRSRPTSLPPACAGGNSETTKSDTLDIASLRKLDQKQLLQAACELHTELAFAKTLVESQDTAILSKDLRIQRKDRKIQALADNNELLSNELERQKAANRDLQAEIRRVANPAKTYLNESQGLHQAEAVDKDAVHLPRSQDLLDIAKARAEDNISTIEDVQRIYRDESQDDNEHNEAEDEDEDDEDEDNQDKDHQDEDDNGDGNEARNKAFGAQDLPATSPKPGIFNAAPLRKILMDIEEENHRGELVMPGSNLPPAAEFLMGSENLTPKSGSDKPGTTTAEEWITTSDMPLQSESSIREAFRQEQEPPSALLRTESAEELAQYCDFESFIYDMWTQFANPVFDIPMRFKKMASEKYHIQGDEGSQVFLLDVPKTLSRRVGDSGLQNFGNAEAIHQLVKNLNEEGINPEDIVILCFFWAQVALLREFITPLEDGTRRYHRICCLEDFVGQESQVVIVDFVAAENLGHLNRQAHTWAYDRQGVRNYIQLKSELRNQVMNWHRINFALTHAMNGLVIVGQLAFFVSSTKRHRGRLVNSLFCLAADMEERGLIYSAEDILDSHPKAVERRQTLRMTQEEIARATAEELRERQAYIEHKLQWGRNNL